MDGKWRGPSFTSSVASGRAASIAPMSYGPAMFTDSEVERYSRQLVLSDWGGPGQQRLKAARVLIVGVGGLGGPAAMALAASGVGTLGLVDHDVVALSNLHRQTQFQTGDVGASKVRAAIRRLAGLNPEVVLEPHPGRIEPGNARGLISRYDLVLDGTDDFAARATINAACVAEGLTLVSGAVARWTGQVGVFTARPCWRCLVPETPPDADTCATVGVAGPLTGTIGGLMALEAVKLLTGAGEPLLGRLLVYDGLSGVARTVRIAADPVCSVCGEGARRQPGAPDVTNPG